MHFDVSPSLVCASFSRLSRALTSLASVTSSLVTNSFSHDSVELLRLLPLVLSAPATADCDVISDDAAPLTNDMFVRGK